MTSVQRQIVDNRSNETFRMATAAMEQLEGYQYITRTRLYDKCKDIGVKCVIGNGQVRVTVFVNDVVSLVLTPVATLKDKANDGWAEHAILVARWRVEKTEQADLAAAEVEFRSRCGVFQSACGFMCCDWYRVI